MLTGLGIGGMLAAINAVTAEFANVRRRNLALAIMVIGYPIGAVVGGTISAFLLKDGDWRAVFEFGAIVTACFIPIVWFFVPEPVHFLVSRRPAGALEKVNRTLARMGHGPSTRFRSPRRRRRAVGRRHIAAGAAPHHDPPDARLFRAHRQFLLHPQMGAEDRRRSRLIRRRGGGVLVWANVGGAVGGAIFGLFAQRFALKP